MEVTVKSCVKAKDWTNPQGKAVPIFKVELSDGSTGDIMGTEIPVGTPLSDLEVSEGQYGKKFKMKSKGGGGFQRGGGAPKGNESFAFSYSKDLCVADKVQLKDIFIMADKIYDWLEAKKK